jgi:hypothetical protein
MKFSLNAEDFELVLKITKDDGDKTEIYLKKSKKNELEKVIILETSEYVSIMWIYGERK